MLHTDWKLFRISQNQVQNEWFAKKVWWLIDNTLAEMFRQTYQSPGNSDYIPFISCLHNNVLNCANYGLTKDTEIKVFTLKLCLKLQP
jgi:hypothetical protein